MITEAVWTLDEYNVWNFRFSEGAIDVHAFIQQRPSYCDRGHWSFNCDARGLSLDGADSFPRYFMDLDAAMVEATTWLNWRVYKVPFNPSKIPPIYREYGHYSGGDVQREKVAG